MVKLLVTVRFSSGKKVAPADKEADDLALVGNGFVVGLGGIL